MLRRSIFVLLPLLLIVPARASDHRSDKLLLIPEPGTIFTVEGHYPQGNETCEFRRRKPLRAKYRGTLELELDAEGRVKMINALTFDHYLRGLAEVPTSWPSAALRAQVIAARSYALHGLRRDRSVSAERGYDICSTDQCQVYRGATVELGAFGDRWVRAVARTRGQVLTYRGSPIQAFYFSTSDGRTRRSFPGGTPQPWLPSVAGRDGDAPLARWTARIRVSDIGRILDRSGDWPGGRVDRVSVEDDEVVVQGPRGRRAVALTRFRSAMNAEAPCVDASRYPAPKGSAVGSRLPQTIPSTSFSIERRGGDLVVRGRGWGHFVGMSQWGANALAERGRSAREILKHYYGPASIQRVREPSRIRVLAAEGMRLVRIGIDGPVRVRTGTGSRLEPARAFEIRGGERLEIRRGRGPSLAPVLAVEVGTRTLTALPSAVVSVPIESPRAIKVRAEILQGRAVIARTPERSVEAGARAVEVSLVSDDGAPLPAGRYQIVIEAFDGLDRIRTEPVALTVLAPSPSPVAAEPREDPDDRTLPLLIALAALLGVAGLLVRSRLTRR